MSEATTPPVVPVSRPPFLFGDSQTPSQETRDRQDAWFNHDTLDRIGMPAVIPNGRSSDYELILGDPFLYFLQRRLGLVPFWQSRDCLVHGQWFHTAGELDNFACPTPQVLGYQEKLELRLKELQKTGEQAGLSTDMLRKFYDNERRMAQEALVWYECSCLVPIPNFLVADSTSRTTTWRNIIRLSRFKVLARESLFQVPIPLPSYTFTFGFQPDLLLYDRMTNSIWIVDWKTTDKAPSERAVSLSFETQTLLYMTLVHELLSIGFLQKTYDLPLDCTLGPMVHILVQKPSIKMCGKDRGYRLVDVTPKTGKNKGITRQEKEFYGEPVHQLYLNRCRDWMLGRGDYASESDERAQEPTVNVSLIKPTILSEPHVKRQIELRMELIAEHATRPPIPANFLQSAVSPSPDYAPFYTASPVDWPLIASERGLIVSRRA